MLQCAPFPLMAWVVRCPVEECDDVLASVRGLVLHMRADHSLSKNLDIPCPVGICSNRFRSSETFRKHVSTKHAREYKKDKHISAAGRKLYRQYVQSPEDFGQEVNHVDSNDINLQSSSPEVTAAEVFEGVLSALDARTSKLRLHLEHTYELPNSVACRIYEETVHFGISLLRELGEAALLRMSECGFKDYLLESILEPPGLDKIFGAPRNGSIETLINLGYVAPVEYDVLQLATDLGVPIAPVGEAKLKIHYVPVLETLKSYLSHEDVFRSVMSESLNSKNFDGFTSGTLFKEHPLFSIEPHALRINLYTDELEVCNFLGGNNKKHKIAVVYFQVGNIGPKYLSSLQSIHLALVVKWNYVVRVGYRVVLDPLIKDLQ